MKTEKENKLSFLDVEIIREQGKFTTTIYRKPTFSGVYSNFESFLPLVYKFGMVYTLVYRYFRICSNTKQGFSILSVTKTLYPEILYLVLLINFSVVSAMSPIMVTVSDSQI